MSGKAIELGYTSADLLHTFDAEQAMELEARDDVIDELHSYLNAQLTDEFRAWSIAATVNVTLLAGCGRPRRPTEDADPPPVMG